jgi:LemA protein
MANPLSNKRTLIVIIIVAIIVIMMLSVILAYNSVISKEQNVNNGASEIKNRFSTKVEILSNLLQQTVFYTTYESSLITNLTALQTQWQDAMANKASDPTLINISSQLDTTFVLVLSTWVNYPQLKASSIISQYMGEIVDQNEMLAYARSNYNDAVRDYNSAIKSFPMMMFSGSFGFSEKPYWGNQQSTDPTNL